MWTKFVLIACVTASLGMSQNVPSAAPRVATGAVSFLGVAIQEIDSDRAKALKLPEEAGVEVTRIAPDSPAEKAGLKTGDVLTQYNGQRVEGIDQFSRMVRETPAGREVRIGILRNGSAQIISAKIAARPLITGQLVPAPTALPAFDYRFPDMPQSRMTWRSTILGVDVETLEGQLAEFFGVKEGVLVRMVNKDSPADKAGIRAGDVIVRLDDVKVATPADISAHLRGARGRPVSVSVVRDRKEITVMLAVATGPDRSLGQWSGSSRTVLV
jgi:serine protease Do